jgi:hypothetical protein
MLETNSQTLPSKNLKFAGILALALTFVFGGIEARAQQPKKVPRIGYLSIGDPATESTRAEGIRLALRELGYIEGQNIGLGRCALRTISTGYSLRSVSCARMDSTCLSRAR